jgi:hypothetical protein
LVTNYKQVKTSGYLARKLALLTVDTLLDWNNEDCGTKHGVEVFIENESTFKRLIGRFTVDGNVVEDSDLDEAIGETVELRSPITCCGANGICRKCYGELAILNRELHVGILGVLILSSQITQMLLSTKHLLQTRSEKIDWPEDIFDIFIIDKDQMIPTGAVDAITISREDICDDEDDTYIRKFSFKFTTDNGTVIKEVESPLPLYLNDHVIKIIAEEDDELQWNINMSGVSPFYYSMENEELSKSLKMILDLIEKNEHLGLGHDINAIMNKFLQLLNESNIIIQSVHVELILRELLRSTTDILEKPNFSGKKFPEYVVLRLSEAILNSPTLSTSLSFQEIKKQIHDYGSFRRHETGMLDGLFV